jgi:spore germination protein GerM
MSHEKKMKDLMARLAAMSPEPPPYPDEAPMASHREVKRTRPALVFAAAAALVIVLAVPLFLFTGGEEPDVLATSTTTSVATTTVVPEPTTTTTAREETTTTVSMVESWSGLVFFYQTPENAFVTSPALVPVEVTVEGPFEDDVEFSRAIGAAVAQGADLPAGLETAIPADVVVESQTRDGVTVIADMNAAFLDGAGGALADFTMLNQLIYTLTDERFPNVLFTVDGEPVETFGTEGIVLTEPVNRESFLDHVHVINLTSPIQVQEDGYLIEGLADVFEANLNVAVLDAEGEIVEERFVTASCGTGCWGDFSMTIPADLIVPGESSIQVYARSAEDGSPVGVITVPIPEGDVWEIASGG